MYFIFFVNLEKIYKYNDTSTTTIDSYIQTLFQLDIVTKSTIQALILYILNRFFTFNVGKADKRDTRRVLTLSSLCLT